MPADLFLQTKEELLEHFGGVSIEPGSVAGTWIGAGGRYEDELLRISVVGTSGPLDDRSIRDLKTRLLRRLEQEEIFVVAHPVELF